MRKHLKVNLVSVSILGIVKNYFSNLLSLVLSFPLHTHHSHYSEYLLDISDWILYLATISDK